tara:strand:+ start:129 stop:548 length:420 start_codon:yes stop_codon:yes gene_type:complete
LEDVDHPQVEQVILQRLIFHKAIQAVTDQQMIKLVAVAAVEPVQQEVQCNQHLLQEFVEKVVMVELELAFGQETALQEQVVAVEDLVTAHLHLLQQVEQVVEEMVAVAQTQTDKLEQPILVVVLAVRIVDHPDLTVAQV